MFNRRKPDEPKVPDFGPPEPLTPDLILPHDQVLAMEHEAGPAVPEDDGLDVPPYRPPPAFSAQTLQKDNKMARAPFNPPPPPLPQAPGTAIRPAMPVAPSPRTEGERRTLIVSRGISVQGTIQDAERLVVEGTLEAGTIDGLAELSISHGGVFKGEVEVDEAEIAGTIDGTVTARHALVVRGTGRVLGTAKCKRLQVEDGGQITGRIEMLTDA